MQHPDITLLEKKGHPTKYAPTYIIGICPLCAEDVRSPKHHHYKGYIEKEEVVLHRSCTKTMSAHELLMELQFILVD